MRTLILVISHVQVLDTELFEKKKPLKFASKIFQYLNFHGITSFQFKYFILLIFFGICACTKRLTSWHSYVVFVICLNKIPIKMFSMSQVK